MITVRIADVRDDGGATIWRVTAPTIEDARKLVPGVVEFPLREDEFFRGRGGGGFRSIDRVETDRSD